MHKYRIPFYLSFKVINNEAEYKALLPGLRLAHSMKVQSIYIYSDLNLLLDKL